LTTSARGFFAGFFGAGLGFAFFALGGVCESSDSSSNASLAGLEASSSESGFGRFLDAVVLDFAAVFSVVCAAFFGAALAVEIFLVAFVAFGAAFAFGFWKGCQWLSAPSCY
jgi:hypothetical protein